MKWAYFGLCFIAHKVVVGHRAYEQSIFIQVRSDQHQCTVALYRANWLPDCSVLLIWTGLQQPCVAALTPMTFPLPSECATTQHQCTAALFMANWVPHCYVLLV
ncbi:TPA: hypothetical protein ACH3X3_009818 [Trebouxia sp. C0006]